MAHPNTHPTNPAAINVAVSRALADFAFADHPANINALLHYSALISKWRKAFNLTASARIEDWWVHLIDSLALAQYLSLIHVKHCADIGSGAGFPAIPCAILLPHIHFTLCEIDHNKSAFLRQVMVELGLSNVSLRGDWQRAGAPFPCVTSKAYLTPDSFMMQLPQLLSVGGRGFIFGHENETKVKPAPKPSAPVMQDFLLKSTVTYAVSALSVSEHRLSLLPNSAPHPTRAFHIFQR